MAKGNVCVHKILVSPFTDSLIRLIFAIGVLITRPASVMVLPKLMDWKPRWRLAVSYSFRRSRDISICPYGGAFSTDASVPSRFDRVHCRWRVYDSIYDGPAATTIGVYVFTFEPTTLRSPFVCQQHHLPLEAVLLFYVTGLWGVWRPSDRRITSRPVNIVNTRECRTRSGRKRADGIWNDTNNYDAYYIIVLFSLPDGIDLAVNNK